MRALLRCTSSRSPYRRGGLTFEAPAGKTIGAVTVPLDTLAPGCLAELLSDPHVDSLVGIEDPSRIEGPTAAWFEVGTVEHVQELILNFEQASGESLSTDGTFSGDHLPEIEPLVPDQDSTLLHADPAAGTLIPETETPPAVEGQPPATTTPAAAPAKPKHAPRGSKAAKTPD